MQLRPSQFSRNFLTTMFKHSGKLRQESMGNQKFLDFIISRAFPTLFTSIYPFHGLIGFLVPSRIFIEPYKNFHLKKRSNHDYSNFVVCNFSELL